MKFAVTTLLFSMLFLFNLQLSGQEEYALNLESGKYIPEENFDKFISKELPAEDHIFSDKYYRIIQFYDLPTAQTHEQLKELNIQLLDYLPQRAYMAAIPRQLDKNALADLNIRSIFEPVIAMKVSQKLVAAPEPWMLQRSDFKVILKYHKNLNHDAVVAEMLRNKLPVIKHNGHNNFIETRIPVSNLEQVAMLPFVSHIGPVSAPSVPDDVEGRSLHRANVLDSGLPMGRKYDGTGINVLVRDDGIIGPHIDFQGRLFQELATGGTGTHGDNVGGIMSGAGNFDPTKRGMAAGTGVHVLDYEAEFLDETMDLFFDQDVIVTNSSYSNGCNDGYTEITATVDQQLSQNPTLMHVFSAGNSNNNDCGYGAGDQWGNITGGHKQGKNTLTVANLFDDATLVNSSSRGPAHDGRIKPDIAANGQTQFGTEPNNTYAEFGGTSGAAPGIAGVFAQLQHAHQELTGQIGEAALLKACLLNSANDLGNEGPDFKFGWGQVNAFRAVKTLEENRYQKQTVQPGMTTSVSLEIPENVRTAKIMLYWSDPEAAVGNTRALVNDLDLTVEIAGGTAFPWVLDPTPNQVTLDQPAQRGEDHLNNMEQVSLGDPVAGTYTINVTGTVLPFGAKEFFIVHEFQTDEVALTYPIGGETMVPGELQNIHWDAISQTEDYLLSFSADGGATWEDIASVAGSERMYTNWTVPFVATGNGKIRVTSSNGNENINEIDFNIHTMPENLNVLSACPNGIALEWNPVADATSYEIYMLGEKYMEIIGNSPVNNFLYEPERIRDEAYFSVHAVFSDSSKSRRTNALYFPGGLLNCVQTDDLTAQSTSINANGLLLSCDGLIDEVLMADITNNGLVDQSNFSVFYQIDNEAPVMDEVTVVIAPMETYTHAFSVPFTITEERMYSLKMWISMEDNNYLEDDTIHQTINLQTYDDNGLPLDYTEAFSNEVFPPIDYIIENEDNGSTWGQIEVTQKDGSTGNAAFFNNYDYAAASNENILDGLLTPLIDLENATDEFLLFDLAYREYELNGFNIPDGLRIEVSTDCGASFNDILFEAFGPDLANLSPSTTRFFPGAESDWESYFLDISAYYGQSVIFKFVNLSGYGNNLFLDNINVTSANLNMPVASFTTSAMTVCQGDTVTFTNQSENAELYQWRFGSSLPSSASGAGPHEVIFFGVGNNTVRLITSNLVGADTAFVTITVEPQIVTNFSMDIVSGRTVNFTNNSNSADAYFWDFGDGNTSTAEHPTHTYATNGIYDVILTSSAEFCNDVSRTRILDLSTTNTEDLIQTISVQVTPNPAHDFLNIRINTGDVQLVDWSLINVQGQRLEQGQIITNTMNEISVWDYPAGVYFLQLVSEGELLVTKVVVD